MPSVTYFDMGRVSAAEIQCGFPPQNPSESVMKMLESVAILSGQLPSCSIVEQNPKLQKRHRFSSEFESLLRRRVRHMGKRLDLEWTYIRPSKYSERELDVSCGTHVPRCSIE